MALKQMENEEMIALTSMLVDPEHEYRKTLAGVPVLAAMLPDIDESHRDLCRTHQRELTTERILTILHTVYIVAIAIASSTCSK